jgi:ketosteroid isomerase-like protein
VEAVRRAIAAFNERDLDAAALYLDPGVEVDWSRSLGVDAGIYHGLDAASAFWASWLDLFQEFTLEADDFIECQEHVIVPNLTRMRGRDGIEVEARSASVVTLRNGLILEWRLYQTKAEAVKAVGLEG